MDHIEPATPATDRLPQGPELPKLRTEARLQSAQLERAGLPAVSTVSWARRAARLLDGQATRPSAERITAAVTEAYLDLAMDAFLTANRIRFERLAHIGDAADRASVRGVVVDATVRTLEKLVPRALAGHCDSKAYVDTVFRSQFVEAWRKSRQDEGAMSREDWFCRSQTRRALFAGDPDLLWLADKVTRQLYRAPFRADLERPDPFPLAAWADELAARSVDQVRRMVDEVLQRIAAECPEEYAMNIAAPLQLVHERLGTTGVLVRGEHR